MSSKPIYRRQKLIDLRNKKSWHLFINRRTPKEHFKITSEFNHKNGQVTSVRYEPSLYKHFRNTPTVSVTSKHRRSKHKPKPANTFPYEQSVLFKDASTNEEFENELRKLELVPANRYDQEGPEGGSIGVESDIYEKFLKKISTLDLLSLGAGSIPKVKLESIASQVTIWTPDMGLTPWLDEEDPKCLGMVAAPAGDIPYVENLKDSVPEAFGFVSVLTYPSAKWPQDKKLVNDVFTPQRWNEGDDDVSERHWGLIRNGFLKIPVQTRAACFALMAANMHTGRVIYTTRLRANRMRPTAENQMVLYAEHEDQLTIM